MIRTKRWLLPELDSAAAEQLAREALLPETIAKLLVCRGIASAADAAAFFSPAMEQLHDPFAMLGMDAAVERLQRAASNADPVLIYGDYDVDGTTATVLLKTALERMGGSVRYHIPHRVREGYGMQTGVLREAAADGVKLVVSVDTGIRALAVADEAAELGLELIVTDHHLPDDRGIPRAVAVLNPHQPGCGYPCKDLCGAGVAFKLAQALLESWDRERARAKLLPSFLKLVAIATIADAVPLLGENRAIVALGLRELARPVHPGLRALFRLAELDPARRLSAMDVAFRIAPRINAAGRMDVAGDVVELLTTREPQRAESLAEKLHALNTDRRAVEKEIVAAIATQMAAQDSTAMPHLLVAEGDGWHRGVLGIAASRLVDTYARPALVVSRDGEEAHGSGRSIRAFHLLDALTECADLFTRFGGHAHAVGFSLPSANLPELKRRLEKCAADLLSVEDLLPEINCAAELPLARITPALIDWLRRMEPLGMGNPEPVFIARDAEVCAPPRIMKAEHVRLRLSQQECAHPWNAIGWRMAELVAELRVEQGSRVDLVYRIRENTNPDFAGVELEMVDLRLAASHNAEERPADSSGSAAQERTGSSPR